MTRLSINIISAQFPEGTLKADDRVRISFTAFPSHQKDSFIIPASHLYNINHHWTVDNTASGKFEKAYIVFRKKSFIQKDPIIGTYKLRSANVPQDSARDMNVNLSASSANKKERILQITGNMRVQVYYDNNNRRSSMPTMTPVALGGLFFPQQTANDNNNNNNQNTLPLKQESSLNDMLHQTLFIDGD